jgi:hypothetical protein
LDKVPCSSIYTCQHIKKKCPLCSGAHEATSPACPVRQAKLKEHANFIASTGDFYGT